MKIVKECHCLNQYYYETWNSYINIYLSKIVVLLSNHENYLQTIFLPKNIAYLLSYFLSQHFYATLFIAIAKTTVFNFCFFPLPNKVFVYFMQKTNCIVMEFSN